MTISQWMFKELSTVKKWRPSSCQLFGSLWRVEMLMGHEREWKKEAKVSNSWVEIPQRCLSKEGKIQIPQSLFLKRIQNTITFLYFLCKIPLIRISWINECQLNLNFCGLPTVQRLLNPINTPCKYIYAMLKE